MFQSALKYLSGVTLALGVSFVLFALPAKAMPGALTQWLDACTSPGSCSTWSYGSTSNLTVPQGGWVSLRMHNRWVTSPGQLPLRRDGFRVSDIIMDWGYTCPAGFSCTMLPYYAQGTTPWTVFGKKYNYLAWDSVSNVDYVPVVTFNTTGATRPGTYRVYFTVFENPSVTPPGAMPPNSGCQFPAPGCLGPVDNYVDITVVSSPTNGVCGTANNKTYAADSTDYSPDTQCTGGVADNSAFPTWGNSVTWVCRGTGGRKDSSTCEASRAVPAQCVNITAPDTVNAGEAFAASVTMKNTNNTAWWNNTEAAFKSSVASYFPNDPYRLGSWTPNDNTTWGLTRVDMPMKSIGTSGRYLRIRTPSDTSWVAWREITLYDSAGNRVTPVDATVSSDWRDADYAVGPSGAYDGKGWSVWNSGTYSGWIILDYGRVVDFAALWLLPEQTPNPPNTTHYIEVSNDNINYTQIASIDAQDLRSDVWYIVDSYAKNNNNITYNVTATAPSTPGTYAFNWNMVHEGVEWFPDASACKKDITVVSPTNGVCGTANGKTYSSTATGYSPDTQCASGTSTNTAFPATGSSVSWVCTGSGGGTDSDTCSASHSAPAEPSISLNPNTFSFSGISGGATPAAQTMTIRNTGTAALNWTSSGVPGKPGTWCHVSPASGSLAADSQQNVSVSVDSPSNVGTFTDCGIRISDPNATNNPQDVSVTYTVAPPPAVCPSASVTLAASSVIKGTTTQVSAPAGWSGGNFASSNTGVATISGTTVNGVNTGTSNITGSGWTASNGATGCALSAQTLTVTNLPPPTNLGGVNSGAGLSCGQIKVTWTDNAQGETGFKVYRSTSNNSGSATLIATMPSTSSLTTGTNYSYTDTLPAYNVAYYYWVTAYVGSIESSRDSGATGSINNTSCEANLNTSDKDIASVNGVTNPTNACQNNGEFPTNVQFKAGDVVGFNINLCNTAPASGGKDASTITIDDTLYNLARYDNSKALTDPAAWNASVTGGLSIASITPSGTEPDNLRLHIVLSGVIPVGSAARLTFYAKVAFPSNFSGTSSRFQNAASISYNNGVGMTTVPVTKTTPLLLFVKSQTPTKQEVGP